MSGPDSLCWLDEPVKKSSMLDLTSPGQLLGRCPVCGGAVREERLTSGGGVSWLAPVCTACRRALNTCGECCRLMSPEQKPSGGRIWVCACGRWEDR